MHFKTTSITYMPFHNVDAMFMHTVIMVLFTYGYDQIKLKQAYTTSTR